MILLAALAVLAAPATASAAKPSKADRREAQKECRELRGTTEASHEAFKAEYRTFGACVSEKARAPKAERKAARRAAKKACRGEGARCVKAETKAKQAEQDAEDAEDAEEQRNAAQACDEERGDTPESEEAFKDKYGTNANKKNAFGKCVSQKAREAGDDDES